MTGLLRTALAALLAALPTTLLAALRPALLAALGAGVLLLLAPPAGAAPECPVVTVQDSSKAARAVFSGTVTDVERMARTDGQPGALYLSTVTVTRVYRGRIGSETVQVQTDRDRVQCSLGELAIGSEYLFFVSGNGSPWLASGTSGTRVLDPTVVAEVVGLLGEGKPPVAPEPERAELTPADVAEPTTLTRAAAPGAALVLVGLLGLAAVRLLARR